MKLMTLFGAGALAAGTMLAGVPADAQRYGHAQDHGRYDHRYGGRDHFRGGYGYHGRGHGRGYGYGYGRGYGHRRGHLVCRVRRGYYGPVRHCFRVSR